MLVGFRVETDVKSGMVSFQAFFQGLGFGGKEAAGMSAKMQALSFDLASFFNIQDENAQRRFLAALAVIVGHLEMCKESLGLNHLLDSGIAFFEHGGWLC
jgi:hypothetical protein